MVIYKVAPSLTSKSFDGVSALSGEKGQKHQYISQSHRICHPVLKNSPLTKIKEEMNTSVNASMNSSLSPGNQRRSFKSIEKNVVQRRTQIFETEQGNDVNGKINGKDHKDHTTVNSRISSGITCGFTGGIATSTMATPRKTVPSNSVDNSNSNANTNSNSKTDTAGLTVAERAKLFNAGDTKSDAKVTVLKKSPSPEDLSSASSSASSAKPPVSPKKPAVAKKPPFFADTSPPGTGPATGPAESDTTPVKKPPKPERPPAPHLRNVDSSSPSPSSKDKLIRPSSIQAWNNESKNETQESLTPKYAKVNKRTPSIRESQVAPSDSDNSHDTKKVFLENITLKPVEKRIAESVVSTASIQPSSAQNSKPAVGPPASAAGPPPKPPRTFAHDEYLAVKAAKKKDKHGKTQSCVATFDEHHEADGVGPIGSSHIYEEIKSKHDNRAGLIGLQKSRSPSPEPIVYEKVKDTDDGLMNVKRNVRINSDGYSYCTVNEDEETQDKKTFVVTRPAPPPPRPPQPSRSKTLNRKDMSPLVKINKHSKDIDERDIIRKKKKVPTATLR